MPGPPYNSAHEPEHSFLIESSDKSPPAELNRQWSVAAPVMDVVYDDSQEDIESMDMPKISIRPSSFIDVEVDREYIQPTVYC
jgi:hypothetical protein